MDLTPYALGLTAVAIALQSVPAIVKSITKRSDAESDLIVQNLAELKGLKLELREANKRIDVLETQVAAESAARSYADGQLEVFRMQLDRAHTEMETWEKRARKMWAELDDLYRAVASSEQGKSLPPKPGKDWE